MKLSIERFEIISKSEFVDDYSAENENFLVTIWNMHVSGEAWWNWITSEIPSFDSSFDSREEYRAEVQRCENERREFKKKSKKFSDKRTSISTRYTPNFSRR